MQRLFSTFPEGWPGAGLVFLRAATAIPLIHEGIAGLPTAAMPALFALRLVYSGAAALALLGLWTPVAGVLMAVTELCLVFSKVGDSPMHSVLAVVGVAIAMLGPGAWSLDARLFGRKRVRIV